MNIFLKGLCVFLFLVSCMDNNIQSKNCQYTLEMLKDYDSSLVHVNEFGNGIAFSDKIGDRENFSKGVYRFDVQGKLRFYGFYMNDTVYKYAESYDAFGNLLEYEGNTLLEYRIQKGDNDSIKFNAFVSSLSKRYTEIDIIIDNKDTIRPPFLYKSDIYSNVKCFSYQYKVNGKVKEISVVAKMSFVNICSEASFTLYDTTIIPVTKLR
jgi:hypothetical protein